MVDEKFITAKRELHENYVLIKNNDRFLKTIEMFTISAKNAMVDL